MRQGNTESKIIRLISGTFISRILGFLREIIISSKFGATAVSDAFFVALQIPVLFRRILGEEMFEKSNMPTFVSLLHKDKKRAWAFLSMLFWYSLIISVLLVIFLYAFRGRLISLLAPGFTDEHTIALANKMAVYIIPYLILTTVYSFLGTIFNFTERQFIFSIAPAISNLGIIIVLLSFYPYFKEISLPLGFLIGGVLYILFLLPFFATGPYRQKYLPKLSFSLNCEKSSLKLISFESSWVFMQAVLGKSVDYVDRAIASFLATGSISGLWYAKRLENLPSAIVAMSISRAIQSELSFYYSKNDIKNFRNTIQHGIRLNLLIIMPLTAVSLIMARPITEFIFKRGSFDDTAAIMTSNAFIAYGAGILAVSLYNMFSRVYSVLIKNKYTTKVMFFSSILNIVLSIILANTRLELAGIALASSVSFYVSAFFLYSGINRELDQKGHKLQTFDILSYFARVLFACAVMSYSIMLIYNYLSAIVISDWYILGLNIRLLALMSLSSTAGFIIFSLICYFSGIKFIIMVFKLLKK